MHKHITPLVLLLTPVSALAHNGSHSGMQGIEVLTHQLLQHSPTVAAGIAVVALGYGLMRRRSYRRTE